MSESTNQFANSHLESRPFLLSPAAGRYFPASVIEESRQRITQNVERSSGIALVIAGAGLGKSMLLEVLAAQFADERPVISLAGAQLCTRRALLQMILFQLGLPFRDLTEGELRLSILSHLQSQADAQRPGSAASRLLLLVDEAESLPARLLEELRVLTNVARGGCPLVDLVIAGGPALEEQLAEPEMEALSQRLSVRCYLAPFGREETLAYVRSQVNASGGNPEEFFTPGGLEAMFAATDGIPRLINQLGNQLAWSAEQRGTLPINEATVQAAWAEIQQLPAPWNVREEPLAVAAPTNSSDVDESDSAAIDAGTDGGGEAHVFEFGGDNTAETDAAETYDAADEQDSAEETLPASIPFARAEPSNLEVSTDATIDATERLLAELGELDSSELSFDFSSNSFADDSSSQVVESDDEPAGCDDPFGDGFDEEEIVIDQFGDFEPSMLAFAPDVMNFMDLGFAQELDTIATTELPQLAPKPILAPVVFEDESEAAETLEAIEPTELDEDEHDLPSPARRSELASTVTIVEKPSSPSLETEFADPVFAPAAASNPSKLLVLEDDGRGTVEIVPGRQFRRLFSTLEAGS